MNRFLNYLVILPILSIAFFLSCAPEEDIRLSLDKTSFDLYVGDTQVIKANASTSNRKSEGKWSSSNNTVATISPMQGGVEVRGVSPGLAIITLQVGDVSASCSVTVKEVKVTDITLDKKTLSLTEGETYLLSAKVFPENATDRSVTWSSNNTSVATVSSSGLVTAKAAGTATIIVKTADGSKTATCKVTVTAATVAVTGVGLNKSSLSLTVGDSETLTATVSPSNATNKNVTWSSSSTSVATVSSSGLVTAKAAGSATITVKTSDGSKTATCTVTVRSATVAVTGVSLDKSSLSMMVGDSETLTATIAPTNATNKNVTWSSSSTTVVTVSSTGLVTAKAAGTATITVRTSDGGYTATCKLAVQSRLTINGYEYVEMGDGLKWATMNVGASKPEEYGNYYAWGETSPKSNYDWSTYKYGKSTTSLTKYVTSSSYGTVDNKTTLEKSDDAASVNWGGSWRMPTDSEWTWLRTNCTWTWTTSYNGTGVAGYSVTSNVSGYIGNSIFFPAAGYLIGSNTKDANSLGAYWSSSLSTSYDYVGSCFFRRSQFSMSTNIRHCGLSVRPVSE